MTELDRWLDRVHCGDCLDVLRELPDCSVALCATDPPYGIAFMARGWDQEIPARAIWAEVLRVLKPGASCFVCAGSRQDTILGLLTDLREVGFDIQHAALSWVYWNGFPKSTSVSKSIDKAAFLAWLRETPEGKTATRQELMGWGAEEVRKAASAAVNGAYSAEPDNTAACPDNMLKAGGENARPWQAEYGTGTGTRLLAAMQARFGDAPGVRAATGTKQVSSGLRRYEDMQHAQGYRDRTDSTRDNGCQAITSPSTPDALTWDGWHSGSVPLKPMTEHILWVTKPAEPGPARNNVLKWGTGAVNVDGCRVPFEGADDKDGARTVHGLCEQIAYVDSNLGRTAKQSFKPAEQGRYPSNLLVTARALGDDSKYADIDAWAREHGISDEWLDAALSAGVLRVPKPSRSEKNAGCESASQGSTYNRKCAACGKWERAQGIDPHRYTCTCQDSQWIEPKASHPTVKPVTLMAYLCVLACPHGGAVLDPFLGSGTTGVAAVQCGMHYIGIEREPEYVAIAEARIAAAIRDHQPTLAI